MGQRAAEGLAEGTAGPSFIPIQDTNCCDEVSKGPQISSLTSAEENVPSVSFDQAALLKVRWISGR